MVQIVQTRDVSVGGRGVIRFAGCVGWGGVIRFAGCVGGMRGVGVGRRWEGKLTVIEIGYIGVKEYT